MYKLYSKLIVLIIALSMLIYYVTSARSKGKLDNRLQVICTTSIIADTVRMIGGEIVRVQQLMGPGIDPHLYRATEGDVYALSSADLVFYNGLHLEGKMAEILKNMQAYVPTIAVTDTIPINKLIKSEFIDMYDPHVWHDVSLWILVATYIRDSLMQQDPEHKNYYQQNASQYLKQLKLLDDTVHSMVHTIHKPVLVTAHDAFAYFGRAYGFTVVGLQGINTDAQVSTKDVQNIADFITEHKVPAIFLESSIPERHIRAVQVAVQARGWNVAIAPEIFSDALGNPDGTAGTYHGMIMHNIETILSALQK